MSFSTFDPGLWQFKTHRRSLLMKCAPEAMYKKKTVRSSSDRDKGGGGGGGGMAIHRGN